MGELANVKERLLQNRSRERFTNYDNIRADPNLTVADKIITYQKAIDNASLQGESLERCFKQSIRFYYEMRRLELDGLNFLESYTSLLSFTTS